MSNFSFIKTPILGAIEVTPKKFGDARGFFMETYQKNVFAEGGIDAEFVQDNHSSSVKGVLRGLHLQKNNPQGKLVRVTQGEVYDVAVDLRPDSESYGKTHAVVLTADTGNMFYVPPGCAHGFLVLSEQAQFCYKCTDFYDPTDEGGIIYNDKTLNIEWPVLEVEFSLSAKDLKLATFAEQDFSYYRGR